MSELLEANNVPLDINSLVFYNNTTPQAIHIKNRSFEATTNIGLNF